VYFVMALVEGESLAAVMARAPRITVPQVRRVLHDVADALAFAHAHGVIHRDIKPDNILLDRESGRPMVTDFGIARAAEADGHLTVTGVAVGTPAYMSPEQSLGERELDGRSDIYSLGVVGYQMLAGELPFKANSTPAMMMKHVSTIPLPVRERRPDTPAALAAAVDRALAKRPEDRWPTAAAFRDAVDARDARVAPYEHRAMEPAPVPQAVVAVPGIPIGPLSPFAAALPPDHPARDLSYFMLTRQERKELRREYRHHRFNALPLDQRIARFRRNLVSSVASVGFLAMVNLLTSPNFPWFIFPAFAIASGVLSKWGSLWSEGVTLRQIFGRAPLSAAQRAALPGGGAAPAIAPPTAPPADVNALALAIAPAEVVAGPHGAAVKRAATDRAAVLGIVNSLGKSDRDLIPDVVPTVNALAERVGSVAQLLHHLDADISPRQLADLDLRIAAVKAEPAESTDHERRLSLLERQRTSLSELATRRARLEGQLESAGIALQNLKYDLLKLRSSGVQSALGEVTSATMEARALSKEIGHVLDAADEIRKL
jgi:serine/threonine-protein kinase